MKLIGILLLLGASVAWPTDDEKDVPYSNEIDDLPHEYDDIDAAVLFKDLFGTNGADLEQYPELQKYFNNDTHTIGDDPIDMGKNNSLPRVPVELRTVVSSKQKTKHFCWCIILCLIFSRVSFNTMDTQSKCIM